MQRRLGADPAGPGISFDIVLKSISGTSFKTFLTSWEIVETAPSEAFQGAAEEIVEVDIDEKEIVDLDTNILVNSDLIDYGNNHFIIVSRDVIENLEEILKVTLD